MGSGDFHALNQLDLFVAANRRPPVEPLRRFAEQEREKFSGEYENRNKPRPDKMRLAVACALMRDKLLYKKLVDYETAVDYYFYQKQRSYGMFEPDLGPRPDETISHNRIQKLVATYLQDKSSDLAEEIKKELRSLFSC